MRGLDLSVAAGNSQGLKDVDNVKVHVFYALIITPVLPLMDKPNAQQSA